MTRSFRRRWTKVVILSSAGAFVPSCIATLAGALDQLVAPSATQNALTLPFGLFRNFLQIIGFF